MAQILFFGASSVYGVGGTGGGVADYLKRDLHQAMYGPEGLGESHAIYNLGISGASTEDLLDRLPKELEHRSRKDKTIVCLSLGGNDTKDLDDPNDTSKDEQYRSNLQKILDLIKPQADYIVFYGITPVDETKTNPRVHKDGTKVYFFNSTRKRLEKILIEVAQDNNVQAIPIFDEAQKLNWIDYLYEDGLHPNTKGHKWIAERIKPIIWEQISPS